MPKKLYVGKLAFTVQNEHLEPMKGKIAYRLGNPRKSQRTRAIRPGTAEGFHCGQSQAVSGGSDSARASAGDAGRAPGLLWLGLLPRRVHQLGYDLRTVLGCRDDI